MENGRPQNGFKSPPKGEFKVDLKPLSILGPPVFLGCWLQGLMDKSNLIIHLDNVTGTGKNISHSPVAITTTNMATTFLILVSFLVGTTVNGFFFWVLKVKIKRTVNTIWFLHLVLSYLIFCSLLPFFAVYNVLGFHWIFGEVVCKLCSFFFSLGMFTAVFLLTVISLDRYLLTCHPIWCQQNRTIPRAWRVITGVWLVSIALSSPFVAFSQVHEVMDRIKCLNYMFSSVRDGTKMRSMWDRVQLVLFMVWFLLAFLLPFFIILACYGLMGQEMKKKRLARTGKPFRILAAAVSSFFICWLPHHLYYGSLLFQGVPDLVVDILWIIMAIGACFNICFTPILYLFVGEKFQQVFKTSVLTLLKRGFMDLPVMPEDNLIEVRGPPP